MNYFERLIRRALLEAAEQAGAPLLDPFENEAPLLLDTPPIVRASSPAPVAPPPTVPRPGIRVEQSTQLITRHEPGIIETREVGAPRDAPVVELPPPTGPEESSTPATPLARADAFMRTLGVEMAQHVTATPPAPRKHAPRPADDAKPAAVHLAAEAPRLEAKQHEERAGERATPATIAPPPAPRREPVAGPDHGQPPVSVAASTSPPRRAAEQAATPKPVREVVRERIHVVKVVREGALETGANAGAAPPTFGAAQL